MRRSQRVHKAAARVRSHTEARAPTLIPLPPTLIPTFATPCALCSSSPQSCRLFRAPPLQVLVHSKLGLMGGRALELTVRSRELRTTDAVYRQLQELLQQAN
jgi:hypothetical protein